MSPLAGNVKESDILAALVRRIGATLESDFERRHEAEDRAEPDRLCPLQSALFLAQSAKLKSQSTSVWAIEEGLLNGFAVEVATKGTPPGVIWGWGLGSSDLVVEGFGVDHLGLARRLMVDGVI
jgi:hypothetical protein